MFLTSRSGWLAAVGASAVLASAYGCHEKAEKAPETSVIAGAGESAGETSSAAGAGNSGGASEGLGTGGVDDASAGSSGADDSSYAGSGLEGSSCRSGQTRCHGQLGFQRCNPDGKWGTSQSCGGYSANGTSSYCALVDDGGKPWAECVDPACWWWLQSGSDLSGGLAGVCVGADKVRSCKSSFLTPPLACNGVCRRVGELDGRVLGFCDTGCADGERECLGGALYRECVAGRWSSQAQTCADGETCQPLSAGFHSDIKCGGACEAGTSRCSLDGTSIETCTEANEWEQAPPCMLGRCVESGAQAQCQTECQPGEHACAFDGAPSELTCSDLGLWSEPVACEANATCRVGTAGSLGCMKCVGPNTPGGNSWGVADSQCADGVAECGDNGYAASKPCTAGQTCVELTRGAAKLAYCK
jgi:hypothetical protein